MPLGTPVVSFRTQVTRKQQPSPPIRVSTALSHMVLGIATTIDWTLGGLRILGYSEAHGKQVPPSPTPRSSQRPEGRGEGTLGQQQRILRGANNGRASCPSSESYALMVLGSSGQSSGSNLMPTPPSCRATDVKREIDEHWCAPVIRYADMPAHSITTSIR